MSRSLLDEIPAKPVQLHGILREHPVRGGRDVKRRVGQNAFESPARDGLEQIAREDLDIRLFIEPGVEPGKERPRGW